MNKIFFISGLGADERVFDKISNFDNYQKVFIPWKDNSKKDSLNSYSSKLFEDIQLNENDILIGLSFGGLIAQEVAKTYGLNKIILLSSFRNRNDLNPLFSFLLFLRLNYFIPPFKIPLFSPILRKLFTTKSKAGGNLLNEMVINTNLQLMKWSIEQIRKAKDSNNSKTKIYSLIGTKDNLVRLWKNENTITIKDGGHFMVYEQAELINEHLKKILN